MEELKIQSSSKSIAITGGSGYLGYHIGASLFRKGHFVTLIDLVEPHPEFLEGGVPISLKGRKNKDAMTFMKVSITSLSEVERAFELIKPDCVIHCASYGMSGEQQMPCAWDKTEEINIGGTKNVLKACCSQGVSGVVYTSSFNVIFGGQEIINGDESLPYFPLHRHVDHYSRTKSVAEQLVLMADGKTGKDGTVLRTCSLRLAGLMGVKEKRHLPRIVDQLPQLKFWYGYGDGAYVQFLSLDNAVQAHVKATEGLLSTPEVVGGEAYFISDEEPITNFRYFKPLIERLGYPYPTWKLPMWVLWFVVYLIQVTYLVLDKINPNWTFTPFLTPAEVYKTGVTHYFSSEKARKHFGFCPERPNEVIFDVAEYFFQKKEANKLIVKPYAQQYQKMFGMMICLFSFIYCVINFV